MPENDDQITARKYPYNACELLCCEYVFNVKAFLEKEKDKTYEDDEDEEKEIDEEENGNNEETEKDEFNSIDNDTPLPVVPSHVDNNEESQPQTEEEQTNVQNIEDKQKETQIPLPQIPPPKPKTQLEKLYSIYDHLFSFLNSPPTDTNNYVLMGYFCKIVSSFLTAKPDIMLKYIFSDRPNTLQKLLTHISRKAIGTIIENIVNSINEQEHSVEHNDYLLSIATCLINTIKNEQSSILENEIACNTLVNCFVISKKSNFIFLIKSDIFTTLHNCLKHYLSVNNTPKNSIYFKIIYKH